MSQTATSFVPSQQSWQKQLLKQLADGIVTLTLLLVCGVLAHAQGRDQSWNELKAMQARERASLYNRHQSELNVVIKIQQAELSGSKGKVRRDIIEANRIERETLLQRHSNERSEIAKEHANERVKFRDAPDRRLNASRKVVI